ncbi:hypothetical protein [Rheinheimera baltica]|uniref:hypothetical protein n=1 Tax=Rheinheimera baltica TaxID=67576 RepID=UPI00273E9E9A|nr:hypothetical protein [Rheinheimera baltica]MDP5190312.1 hypothetical protein [Rheinheimera baltica]
MSQQYTQGFCIDRIYMLLGKAANTQAALNLDILPPEQQYITWQQHHLAASFVLPVKAKETLTERLTALLTLLFAQMDDELVNETVYLVLPEFPGVDNQQLNALLQHLMRHFPSLLLSDTCRVFPYGSAGALMALSMAQQQLQQDANATVWLLAVDSQALDEVLQCYATAEVAGEPSEGAIALRLSRTNAVVNVHTIASDASPASSAEPEPAMAALFQHVAANLPTTLNQLYLPDCGDVNATERWIAQYHYLHGAVNQDTEHVFASYATGELGACGGLYRLLHVYRGYQREYLQGLTLQCELSPALYRAIAVFSKAGTLVKNKEV